jgi:hypothetical protein
MKYALEGLIVALAAFTIPNNKLDINDRHYRSRGHVHVLCPRLLCT